MDIKEEARKHFEGVARALEKVDKVEVENAIGLLRKAKEDKGFVWVIGNGGSAATAEHFSNDLLKMAGIRAIALPGMVPTITAYGNDDGWENMFKNPLLGLHGPQDVLVVISCSGNSENVVEAAHWWGERLIILTGDKPMESDIVLKSDTIKSSECVLICAEDPDITVQEDVHLAVCHAIAKALRE